MNKPLYLSILLLTLLSPAAAKKGRDGLHDVRDYGARGDGVTLDTRAIQKAIDDCAQSGGVVLLRGGNYLSGTLVLKSNVTLQIASGATLLGSANLADYPEIHGKVPSYNDLFLRHSLIYAEDQHDVAIIGPGTIDGQGGHFPVVSMEKPHRYKKRPYILRLNQCKNVRVENLTMRNSAMWMQHYLACENVVLRGLWVYNHCNKNNDMMDIDGCRDVVVSDCIGDTDDDAITLKSTSERPCENITISNCIVSSHCNAIKCGTEAIGGFKNIAISNIVIRPSQHPTKISGAMEGLGGIVLTEVDGGVLDGVAITNIRITGTRVPIFIRLGDRGRTIRPELPKPGIGSVRNISINQLLATDAGSVGCSITGMPGRPLENIALHGINIQFKGGVAAGDSLWQVDELPGEYPESTMFGELPSYGFFCRHVKGLTMHEIRLDFEQADSRPALIAEDVTDFSLRGLSAAAGPAARNLMEFRDTREVFVSGCRAIPAIPCLVRIEGKETRSVELNGNSTASFARLYQLGPESSGREIHAPGSFEK